MNWILNILKKLYKKICGGFEDFFYQLTDKQTLWSFYIVFVVVAYFFICVVFPYAESKDIDPAYMLLLILLPVFIIGWLYRRIWVGLSHRDSDLKKKEYIEKAPLNWKRFELKVDKWAPVVDFEVFDRDLVYSKLTPWQQVMGDKKFLCERLKPLGWEYEEFQTIYDKAHCSFGKYDFHFKRGKSLVCISADLKGYSVQKEKLKEMDSIAEIGVYEKTSGDSKTIEQIQHYLEGDKYG